MALLEIEHIHLSNHGLQATVGGGLAVNGYPRPPTAPEAERSAAWSRVGET
jgi:hypothetical protein